MNRFSHFVLGFGIIVTFSALTVNLTFAQFPDPKDEAKLYQLAKKEGTLVWYGSLPFEEMTENAKDFEAKYPGVKVEVLRIVGPTQYQRFLHETNAKQYMADILANSDYPMMKSLMQLGHLAEWKVSTSDRIESSFRMGNYNYAPSVGDIAIVYNINKVTPEEVKILGSSWKGVLNPRFKGRFTVFPNKCGMCYGGVHMFLDPKYSKVFGPDFLKAVGAQKPALYPDGIAGIDRMVAGEHDFTYWAAEATVYTRWMQGAPIRWVHPDPTPVWANVWFGISKNAPHPNAGRLFLNWLMSETGALAQQRTGRKTILEGFKDNRKVTSEPWYDPIKTPYNVDFDRWEKNYNADMDFWAKLLMESRWHLVGRLETILLRFGFTKGHLVALLHALKQTLPVLCQKQLQCFPWDQD